jgi:hypothetical protein
MTEEQRQEYELTRDRNQVEIARLIEEALKFLSERHKLEAEALKLGVEAKKLPWDRWLGPVVIIVAALLTSLIGGGIGAAMVQHWLRAPAGIG